MFSIRNLLIVTAVSFAAVCAMVPQPAHAELIEIAASAQRALRFDTSVVRSSAGPRVSSSDTSVVSSKRTSSSSANENATRPERSSFMISMGDALIGLLVLVLAVGAAGGLARLSGSRSERSSRW